MAFIIVVLGNIISTLTPPLCRVLWHMLYIRLSEPWWRHQMKTFSALLAFCAGNSPVHGEFPAQRPMVRSFDVFLDLRLYKRLSKHSWCWWFETPSYPLWRHCNDNNNSSAKMGFVVHAWLAFLCVNSLSGVPDYFGRNKISSGGDLSHYSSASLY